MIQAADRLLLRNLLSALLVRHAVPACDHPDLQRLSGTADRDARKIVSDRHAIRIDHKRQLIDVPGKVCRTDTGTVKTHKCRIRLYLIFTVTPGVPAKYKLVRKYFLAVRVLQLPLLHRKLYRCFLMRSDQKLL